MEQHTKPSSQQLSVPGLLVSAADIVSILSNPRHRYVSRDTQHPGRTDIPRVRRSASGWKYASATTLIILIFYVLMASQKDETYPIADVLADSAPGSLTMAELTAIDENSVSPVHFSQFLPDSHSLTSQPLAANIAVEPFVINRWIALQHDAPVSIMDFPGFEFKLSTRGSDVIPLPMDQFIQTGSSQWEVIVGPGITWIDPDDPMWNRVSFAITLIHNREYGVFNGAGLFAWNVDAVTPMRLQFAQDGQPDSSKVDWWGLASIKLQAVSDIPEELVHRFLHQRGTDLKTSNWQDLESLVDNGRLTGLDNDYIRHHVSVSGLAVDDTIYFRSCMTRFAPYPFCSE